MMTSFYVDKLPIYGAAFIDNDRVLFCGGGGPSKTGLTNRLVCYDVKARLNSAKEQMVGREVGILELSGEEDAPMCLAVHGELVLSGINESVKARKASGDNCHLRTFKMSLPDGAIESVSLQLALSHQILDLDMEKDDYQRQVSISKDGRYAVVLSSEGRCGVVETAQMRKIPLATLDSPKRSTMDAVLVKDAVLAASERIVRYIPLPGASGKASKEPESSLGDAESEIFRLDSVKMLGEYSVHRLASIRDGGGICIAMNATDAKRKESYIALFDVRQGRLVQKDVDHYAKRVKDVYVGPSLPSPALPKGVTPTMAAVRDDLKLPKQPRQFMIVTFSDGSVNVHDADKLHPLKSFPSGKLHSFPPSTVAISPDNKRCVTASIDGKVNVIDLVAIDRAAGQTRVHLFVLLFIFVLLIAFIFGRR